MPKIREKLFKNFAGKERFVDTDPLQKANLPTFITQSKKILSKDKAKVESLKEDCVLFSGLYIAFQSHSGNLKQFFKCENLPLPPFLSHMGNLRGGQKADLMKCLTNLPT